MVNEICNKFQQKELNIYRYIATGGMWAEDQLEEIQMSGGKCRHCGKENADNIHTLWNCPIIAKHKKIKIEKVQDYRNLPKAILQGIPESMTWRLDEPFWGKAEVEKPLFRNEIGFKGIAGNMDIRSASNKSANIEYILQNREIPKELNARQIFAKLKECTYNNTSKERPWKCSATAPEEINVYTDGSLLHNKKHFVSIGGAGVWWPKRHIYTCELPEGHYKKGISDGEDEIAEWLQIDEGLMLYSKLGGYGGSSTRSELAAGIIAVAAEGPIHIGSDSKCFIDNANKLLHQIRMQIDHKITGSFKMMETCGTHAPAYTMQRSQCC